MQHLEMKSASLSAERASSSIVANDKLQLSKLRHHQASDAAAFRQLLTETDDLTRVFKRSIADVLTAFKARVLFHGASTCSRVDANAAGCLAGFLEDRNEPVR